jgi:hypothetical protein
MGRPSAIMYLWFMGPCRKRKKVKMEETNEGHAWRKKAKRNRIAPLEQIYSSKIYWSSNILHIKANIGRTSKFIQINM